MAKTLQLGEKIADLFATRIATTKGFTHTGTEVANDVAVITFRRTGGAPQTNDVFTFYLRSLPGRWQIRGGWEMDSPAMEVLSATLEGYVSGSFSRRIGVVRSGTAPRIRPFEFKLNTIEDAVEFCALAYLPLAEEFFEEFSTVDALERVARARLEEPQLPGEGKNNSIIERFVLYCLTIGDDDRADRANCDLVASGQDQNFDFQGYLREYFPGRLSSVAV